MLPSDDRLHHNKRLKIIVLKYALRGLSFILLLSFRVKQTHRGRELIFQKDLHLRKKKKKKSIFLCFAVEK